MSKEVLFKMISYRPLWITLINKKKKKMDLVKSSIISRGTLAKLSNDQSVGMDIIEKICNYLICDISEVAEIILENEMPD